MIYVGAQGNIEGSSGGFRNQHLSVCREKPNRLTPEPKYLKKSIKRIFWITSKLGYKLYLAGFQVLGV